MHLSSASTGAIPGPLPESILLLQSKECTVAQTPSKLRHDCRALPSTFHFFMIVLANLELISHFDQVTKIVRRSTLR